MEGGGREMCIYLRDMKEAVEVAGWRASGTMLPGEGAGENDGEKRCRWRATEEKTSGGAEQEEIDDFDQTATK